MIPDPFEEIKEIREVHAAKFNYDLDAILRDLKEQERRSGYKFVGGACRPKKG